jgi:ketol-acid reductoisomerase
MTDRLAGATVAVLGFGNQGRAQALNLRDSGATVIVGAREGGRGRTSARELGFETLALGEAARRATICAVLLPDDVIPVVWPEIAAGLEPGAGLVFAHGFSLLYGDLDLPDRSDVVLVSPTGPGRVLREVYTRGEGLPAYLAVHRDATGGAWALAESYARGIGSHRARLLRTTVREETEVDLFGEQVVLCGGMEALLTAAWETLVAKGYSPEMAYMECVHQLKYLADLVHGGGIPGLRAGISRTALFGALTRGPRVVGEPSRAAMAEILEEIRSGAFAREFAEEIARGEPRLTEGLAAPLRHPMAEAERRALERRPGPEPPPGESRNPLSKN